MAGLDMDWDTFVQRANMEYRTTDADWDPYARVAILSFDEDTERVCARFNGKNVYPHNASKDKIKNGDVWVVSLVQNGNTNYFARAIKQLDASFLMELNKADQDAVVDFIWEKNRASIEPVLEEKYRAAYTEKFAKTLEEHRKEDKEKIEDLTQRLSELQKVSEEDKASIRSLENSLEALKSSHASFAPQQGPTLPIAPTFIPWGQPETVAPVTRISTDAIMSENFTRSRYSVHLSSDHRFILVTPDPNGNVLCISNTITLAGLETMYPFAGSMELPCNYSNEYNGFLITLR